MYSTVKDDNGKYFCGSEDETVVEERNLKISDIICLQMDLKKIIDECKILVNGNDLSLGIDPLYCFKCIVEGNIETIEEIEKEIKAFKKRNILFINALKELKKRKEREDRLDRLEKKKKEEETKPERRKTRPL
ncbi:hypothetical protein CL6EHI_089460 [Entamoeba histolytica]|uniref:Uncharacterized protein n=2 Tax=Entamoeba histolytica TaxID=5759 RepID=C4MB33_ENTH1|nr:hypothetical protein EHI_089460 [Entamoeba histolytica HM-1:IMSS]EAL42844.1 hypothetical protein EHI_089460 [Entamoeba histolytica HM-1:IMSS]GAT99101.1 hypothetical protein CL6EHI_089460 [Entamoeba histolytica]|eukprot:XP_648232.1 hypothetical protein EHI_089460 [Entamoeba histolytica HM-1:IMSS]